MIRTAFRIIRRDPRGFAMDLLFIIGIAGVVYVAFDGAMALALCDQLRALGASCF